MCSAMVMSALVPKADISLYSMTSSARVGNWGGTVRPSAFAVFKADIDPTNLWVIASS